MKTFSSKTQQKKEEIKVPYHKKPLDMTTAQWQIALRKQFARENPFKIKNTGDRPVFSDFRVHNPASGITYKIAIRSVDSAMNFCTCMDFKTNMLGTCKHIEAVFYHLRKSGLNKKLLQKPFTPPYSSIYLHYGGERTVRLRIGSDDSETYGRWARKHFDKTGILPVHSFGNIEQIIREAKAIHDDFRCYDDAMDFIIGARAKKHREQLLEKISDDRKYFATLLKVKLFPYQVEGIKFAFRAGRCLIADDMGLGKTVQALGVVEMMKKENLLAKVLIVCPTSLKYQWKSEIEKFTGNSAIVIEGNLLKREAIYENECLYKITSYNVIKSDVNRINTCGFDLVILDEAQRIKNWRTQVARNVKKITATYAIVLTGTPLENKIEELYSIVQFVDGFKLGPLYRFLENHQIQDAQTGKVTGYRELNKVGELLRDIVIRRNKKQVHLQLPERMDKNLFVPMTPVQMDVHNEYADKVAKLVNKWKRFGFLNEQDRQRLMISLNMMRMVCNSTYIIDQETRHDTKIDELMCILDNFFSADHEKAVVFSQWERMTRLVANELDARNFRYEYLHGGVPSKERQHLFENFNHNGSSRVFLSTDAGGVGLNLQSASLMINLDIPWNPAVLEQRIGRIYRLGQKRNVSIINLVATGTIEHRMLDVLKFKSSLAKGILDQGENTIFMGESRFKEFMKSVDMISSGIELTGTISDEITPEENESAPHSETAPPEKEGALDGMLDDNITENGQPATIPVSAPDEQHAKRDTETPMQSTRVEQEAVTHLVTSGISFLNRFAQTLSDPQATKNLVSSIVVKDPVSGKTYLKLPVENEQVIENAINTLGNLFKMFQKK